MISSRYQRRPDLPRDMATRLDVRPFGEDKIDQALRRVSGFPPGLIRTLLGSRSDLVPLARTPFYLGLIAEFGRRHHRLPNSQIELFETYILNRLGSDALSVDTILDPSILSTIRSAEEIANFLLTSQYGLEAPLDVLETTFPKADVAFEIQRLADARIMRRGRSSAQKCSFARRRPQEYFVVRYMTRTGVRFDQVGRASIQPCAMPLSYMSRWPPTMRLKRSLGVAGRASVQSRLTRSTIAVANFGGPIHSQQFLVEAFRARPAALGSFRSEISNRVLSVLTPKEDETQFSAAGTDPSAKTNGGPDFVADVASASVRTPDLITAKLAVETIGLFAEDLDGAGCIGGVAKP